MAMQQALVSVVLATYNGERFLPQQLDSILQQTYPNLEIVVVDDGSKDGTIALIQDYMLRYPNVRLIQNEKNLGVTKTFERGIQESRGAYIAFSDQDDLWLPEKLQVLTEAIGDYDAVYANSLLVDEDGQSLGRSFTTIMNMATYRHGGSFLLSNSVPGHAILAKADFLKRILPIPATVLYDLWIGFCAGGNNGIAFVDKVLVHYRQHDSNTVGTRLSSNKRKKKSAQQEFEEKRKELQLLAHAPVKDPFTKKLVNEMLQHFHQRWSFARSAFFFRNFDALLFSKQKPRFRKKLYCLKMFFKPNY